MKADFQFLLLFIFCFLCANSLFAQKIELITFDPDSDVYDKITKSFTDVDLVVEAEVVNSNLVKSTPKGREILTLELKIHDVLKGQLDGNYIKIVIDNQLCANYVLSKLPSGACMYGVQLYPPLGESKIGHTSVSFLNENEGVYSMVLNASSLNYTVNPNCELSNKEALNYDCVTSIECNGRRVFEGVKAMKDFLLNAND